MNIRRTAEMAYTNVLLQSWSGPVSDPLTGEPVNYISRDAYSENPNFYPPSLASESDYNDHAPLV